MKKVLMIMSVLIVFATVGTMISYAADGMYDNTNSTGTMGTMQTITGEVLSIDMANNQIVVKEKKTDEEMTITVIAMDIIKVKKGDMVKIKLQSDGVTAESIKVTKKSKTEKRSNPGNGTKSY